MVRLDLIDVAGSHSDLAGHRYWITEESRPEGTVAGLVPRARFVDLVARLQAQIQIQPRLLRIQIDSDGAPAKFSRNAEGLYCTALVILGSARRVHQLVDHTLKRRRRQDVGVLVLEVAEAEDRLDVRHLSVLPWRVPVPDGERNQMANMLRPDLRTYGYLLRQVLQVLNKLLRHFQASYDQLLQIDLVLLITISNLYVLDVLSALLDLRRDDVEISDGIHALLLEAVRFVWIFDFRIP